MCFVAASCHRCSSTSACGSSRCVNNMCVFDAWESGGQCNNDHYVECDSGTGLAPQQEKDAYCTKGPANSYGTCTLNGNTECTYTWCPGPKEQTCSPKSSLPLPPAIPSTAAVPWWQPKLWNTWDWQLDTSQLDYSRDVDVYEVQMWEHDAKNITMIKTNNYTITDPAKFRKVICYFSGGTWDEIRPDAADFPESILGVRYYGFPQERWLDLTKDGRKIVDPIMIKRFDMAQAKGCDAIEPDNVDGYDTTSHEYSGFNTTYEDQIAFNLWLTEMAHSRGMAIGLKNDINQAKDQRMVQAFDFVVSEQVSLRYVLSSFGIVTNSVYISSYFLPSRCPFSLSSVSNMMSVTGTMTSSPRGNLSFCASTNCRQRISAPWRTTTSTWLF